MSSAYRPRTGYVTGEAETRRRPATDGTATPNTARGEVVRSIDDGLFYDEEVPREGARITRQRRRARWTDGSTWVWTSLHNQVGRGEGSSQLQFDRVIEPTSTQA